MTSFACNGARRSDRSHFPNVGIADDDAIHSVALPLVASASVFAVEPPTQGPNRCPERQMRLCRVSLAEVGNLASPEVSKEVSAKVQAG